MSVMDGKISGGEHGFDGLGFRRRGDLVDLYQIEIKQVTSDIPPHLRPTGSGLQLSDGWTKEKLRVLFNSSDPVAFETQDALRQMMKKYFGTRYSEDFLFEAFAHTLTLPQTKKLIVTRVNASLERLIPDMFKVGRVVGKGNVHLVLVRGKK